jgi:hypothetical protein
VIGSTRNAEVSDIVIRHGRQFRRIGPKIELCARQDACIFAARYEVLAASPLAS